MIDLPAGMAYHPRAGLCVDWQIVESKTWEACHEEFGIGWRRLRFDDWESLWDDLGWWMGDVICGWEARLVGRDESRAPSQEGILWGM